MVAVGTAATRADSALGCCRRGGGGWLPPQRLLAVLVLLAAVPVARCASAAAEGGTALPFGAIGVSEMVPDHETKPLYPEGLLTVPRGGLDVVEDFVEEHMEPRHAVAVGVSGKGTKRHQLLAELAADEGLYPLLAISIQFAKGKSSLTVYRHRYPAVVYEGKWTRSAIRAWLLETAYPPVNRLSQEFATPKYVLENPVGVVLVVKPVDEQTDTLVQALEPYAEKYRQRLKFTFFTKTSDPMIAELCKILGVWTNDELLLLEKPRDQKVRKHTHVPGAPKYRLEGVTPERVEQFFHGYGAGSWPRYYKSASHRSAPVSADGLRELSGWDFVGTVSDPAASVLWRF